MKVLITGGMGVIGAETSRKFVREGHRPVIYSRHRDDRLIFDIVDKIDFEAGDVLDWPRLLDVIKRHRVTHIVHAAGFVGAVSATNPALSIQVNVMGTVNVLEAARAFDVRRLVYTSAKGIYGPVLGEYGPPTYKPMPEDMPKYPQRIYDSAKLMGEQTVLYYAIVENPFRGLPFHHVGGDAKDDFIYNKDSALGIYLATIADKVPCRVYNIGSGIGQSLNDFAAVLRKKLPKADIEIGPGLNFLGMPYPPHGVYDIKRAGEELGFKPEYDLERGVEDYLDALKRIPATSD